MSAILSKNRRGVTLVELLIVISILLGLLALAVPAMRPAMESKQIRDAARAVNVYFSTARSRAIETGRPCGVLLERDPNLPQASITLRQVEVPPPYGGDVIGAMARIQGINSSSARLQLSITNISPGLIKENDLIQLNYQGPLYRIGAPPASLLTGGFIDPTKATDSDGNGYFDEIITLTVDPGPAALPWPTGSWVTLPFTILRQPVTSSTPPLQLQGRSVVDLYESGRDGTANEFADIAGTGGKKPIVVMFSPTGALDDLYIFGNDGVSLTRSIFLLIGRRDRVPLEAATPFTCPAEDGLYNRQDLKNLWVTISPQTGLITTAEIASGADARKFAKEQHRLGGQ